MRLPIDAITLHASTQARVELNLDTVAEYAAVFAAGGTLPDPVVFFDGSQYWLGDGHHTIHGARKAGKTQVVVDLRQGTLRDAILYAVGANATHGLRRSPADKRKAVGLLLADPEWAAWSNRNVARACRVSEEFVARCRSDYPAMDSEPAPESLPPEVQAKVQAIKEAGGTPRVSTTKHGTVTAMDVSKIGRNKPKREPEPDPDMGEDLATLLADAQKDVERLTAEVKAAESDDAKAEAVKWRRAADHAQREHSEAMKRASEAKDREAWAIRQLQRCGKAVGESDPTKIAAAVEAFVRAHAKAKAAA